MTVTDSSGAGHELRHIHVLDGWRAISILFVLAGHLLPLGPKALELNATVAASGMAIFFTLSGFLITRFLIEDGNVVRFLIRRVFRIMPLAWLAMPIAILISGGTLMTYIANLGFFANLPPFYLVPAGAHFWSLCLEMQFYLGVALIIALLGQRGLLLLPLLCLGVTAFRVVHGETMSIVTWFRIDEILAGAIVALVVEGWLGKGSLKLLSRINVPVMLVLLLVSASAWSGAVGYLRPYFAAMMVGASILSCPVWFGWFSRLRWVVYTAQISYALYVFHGIFSHTWLGSGGTVVKYAKRPLLAAVTLLCSHLSTFYYERYFNRLARRLT